MAEIVEIWNCFKPIGKVKKATCQKASKVFHQFHIFYVPGIIHVYKITWKAQQMNLSV
jgi:hypothetical protein